MGAQLTYILAANNIITLRMREVGVELEKFYTHIRILQVIISDSNRRTVHGAGGP